MRVLIVGHGRMGKFHAKTIEAAGDKAITLDPHTPAAYKRWTQVPKVDAAIISVPIPQLHAQALEAIERGIPTLIEKPGAASPTQIADLWAADPLLTVGYLERHNPAAQAFYTALTPGEHVTYTRRGPRTNGNIALDVAAHDLDLHLQHYPTDRTNTVARVTQRGLTFNSELATIHAGTSVFRERTLEAGGLKADLITRVLHLPDGTMQTFPFTDLLAAQWEAFKTDGPLASIHDAMQVIDVLEDSGALDLPVQAAA